MTARHLLPPNASQLEQLAAEALAQIERVPVPIRDLINPDRCPAHLLSYLAWAFSVDRWDATWSEAIKREVIKASYFVHSRKGTIGALRRVVEPLGYLIEVREWWQEQPLGTPGTFRLLVGVLDTGITEEMYQELTWLIDDAKPVSRHLVGLAIGLDVTGTAHVGAALTTGDELSVYPPASRDIEVGGTLAWGAREHVIDTMDIR